MARVLTTLVLGILLSLIATSGQGLSATRSNHTEVFYPSGDLQIQAYLYRPFGSGPFPVVIYNHGARHGGERRSLPQPHIGKLLTGAGYAALVVERRGYGRSDGPTLPEEMGEDRQRLVPRLQAEADDVLASLDYLRTLPFANMKRIGVMGWSYGGIITMFAASRGSTFAVAVNQAGGALTWKGNPDVRAGLIAAAEKTTNPTLLQVAQNDRTTASITTVAEILNRRGVPHRTVIYEPFTPQRVARDVPPGHRLFSAEGVNVWGKDVLEFLGRYLGGKSTDR